MMDDAAILTEAALRLAPEGNPGLAWKTGVQSALRTLMRRIADHKGATYPCFADAPDSADTLLDRLGPLEGWNVARVGDAYQLLLELNPHTENGTLAATRGSSNARQGQGSWYTPEPIAMFMARFAIETQIERLAAEDSPHQLLEILALDPACGAGAFLVEACRQIAGHYAARLFGLDEAALVKSVKPAVMYECIFGVDIDPVAVDMARFACWAEIGGTVPFGFLDRNIICGDVLSGPNVEPPHFTERRARKVANDA
jgi:hypothetical protein